VEQPERPDRPSARAVVLVVEDDRLTRELLQEQLERAGYRGEVAADGITGLARIDAGGIDLVLLDLDLPDLDGLEVCRQVRAHKREVYLPIIMVTGRASEAERNAGFAAGVDDYVTKPLSRADLLDRVQFWVGALQRFRATHEAVAVPIEARALDLARLAQRVGVRVAVALSRRPGALAAGIRRPGGAL
jgi:DNA-binding response OmpR family regulator